MRHEHESSVPNVKRYSEAVVFSVCRVSFLTFFHTTDTALQTMLSVNARHENESSVHNMKRYSEGDALSVCRVAFLTFFPTVRHTMLLVNMRHKHESSVRSVKRYSEAVAFSVSWSLVSSFLSFVLILYE